MLRGEGVAVGGFLHPVVIRSGRGEGVREGNQGLPAHDPSLM